ncbi:hypothetical protein COOONC_15010, partial [Cooperia oncophora]
MLLCVILTLIYIVACGHGLKTETTEVWAGDGPHGRSDRSVKENPFSWTMRVRAVNQERHIVYTKKDASLEEILPEKKDTGEGEAPSENDFIVAKLLAPISATKSSTDDTIEASASDVDDEDYAKSSTVIGAEVTVNATEGPEEASGTTPEEMIMAELLDTSGRVGPITDDLPTATATATSGRGARRIDTGLLEKELMIRTPNVDLVDLRKKLNDSAHLEEMKGDNHRDYGSSYILPVLLSVDYDNNTVPTAFSDIPVLVSVQMNILYLANFDSELMEYSIDVELEMSWYDLR